MVHFCPLGGNVTLLFFFFKETDKRRQPLSSFLFLCLCLSYPSLSHTHTHLAAIVDKSVHCLSDGRVWWLTALHLGFVVVFEVGSHHEEVLPPFVHRNLGFSLNHCVDSSNCGFTHNESVYQKCIRLSVKTLK